MFNVIQTSMKTQKWLSMSAVSDFISFYVMYGNFQLDLNFPDPLATDLLLERNQSLFHSYLLVLALKL